MKKSGVRYLSQLATSRPHAVIISLLRGSQVGCRHIVDSQHNSTIWQSELRSTEDDACMRNESGIESSEQQLQAYSKQRRIQDATKSDHLLFIVNISVEVNIFSPSLVGIL